MSNDKPKTSEEIPPRVVLDVKDARGIRIYDIARDDFLDGATASEVFVAVLNRLHEEASAAHAPRVARGRLQGH